MEPRKKERRLAALNNHLTTQTLLDFDLDEESSDSDFLPPDQEDSDNESRSDNDDDDDDGKSDGSDGSESDDESSGSDLDDLLSKSKATTKTKKSEDVHEQSTMNLLSILETKGGDDTKSVIPRKPICCVCLGDRSDDSNEIVECDNCGVTVHEGCYGITESNSVSSTASSCSTEPWFCEACRADLTDLDCELCPNKGGVFKETDCGRWVSEKIIKKISLLTKKGS